jgi:hypothetical protein
MTLAFGQQNMTGFTLWGMVNEGTNQYAQSAGSVLYDNNYNLTLNGTAYQALQKFWNTDEKTDVNSNGSVTWTSGLNADGTTSLPDDAYYGSYEAIINGQDYPFTFSSSGAIDLTVGSVPEPATLGLAMGALLMFRRPSKRSRDLCSLGNRALGLCRRKL